MEVKISHSSYQYFQGGIVHFSYRRLLHLPLSLESRPLMLTASAASAMPLASPSPLPYFTVVLDQVSHWLPAARPSLVRV